MAEGTVGFVGLGIMGRPMASNLMEAGYDLVLFNRTREKAEELASDGATVADSPREAAEASDVVITMLPDSPEVEENIRGEEGVLAGAAEGTLVIDMSTISPLVSRELAEAGGEQGVGMLDAPVSGGEPMAISGDLSIMVGGSSEDFARAEPILEPLGSSVHVGPAGAGQVVKACNQIIVALNIEAVSEALVLASKAGVEPGPTLEALSGGLAGSKVMDAKTSNFLEHDFDPGFRVELHHKDLGIALEAAREYGVPLPVTALVDQMLQRLQIAGRGDRDHSALLTVVEEAAEHQIGEPAAEATGA